ncbi:thioredoxin-like protein [Chytriomyces cf. hyalinus JEL632]|nr:thioredoxin-like protein [Chytriomyces cf. hyalinus JEL632]
MFKLFSKKGAPSSQHSKTDLLTTVSDKSASSSAANPSTAAKQPPTHPAQQTVETILAHSKIVVFGRSGCLACLKAKKLLDSYQVAYTVVNIDLRDEEDGSEILAYLEMRTGRRSVPNVFVRGESVGGNEDIHDMDRAGSLAALLA